MTSPSSPIPTTPPSPTGALTPKKPIWKRWWFIALGVVLVLAFFGSLGENDSSPSADPTQPATPNAVTTPPQPQEPAATGAPTPAQTQAPVLEPISDAEAQAEFQAYIDERAAAGVMVAKAVTSVTVTDGIVTATFDPAAAGLPQAVFNDLNPFPNLAEFVGSPMAFADEQGDRLRTRVTRVDTVNVDGTPLGSSTAAELYYGGTGQELPDGQ